MQEICTYPNFTGHLKGQNYIFIVGKLDDISSLLKKFLYTKKNVSKGIVFHRYNETLVITFSTDRMSQASIIDKLNIFTSTFKCIIYILSDSSMALNLNNHNTQRHHNFYKLTQNTFGTYSYNSTSVPPKIKQINTPITEFFMNYSIDLTIEEKPKINKSFQEAYKALINKIEFSSFTTSLTDYSSSISEFLKVCDKLKFSNIEKFSVESAINRAEEVLKKEHESIKNAFFEKLINLFLSDDQYCKVKEQKSSYIFKKKNFCEVMDELQKYIEGLEYINIHEIANFCKENIYSFFTNNTKATREHFEKKLKSFYSSYVDTVMNNQREIKSFLECEFKNFLSKRYDYTVKFLWKEYRIADPIISSQNFKFEYNERLILRQVILTEGKFLFVAEGKSVYKIILFKENEVLEISSFAELPELAHGSIPSKLIIVLNKSKKIKIKPKEKSFDSSHCYLNNSAVSYPNFFSKFNTLLFLNERGQVKSFHMWKLVVSDIGINEKASSMRASDCQNLIGISFESYIGVFNLKFEQVFKVNDLVSRTFYLISTQNENIQLFVYESMRVLIYELKKEVKEGKIKMNERYLPDELSCLLSVNAQDKLKFVLFSQKPEYSNSLLTHYKQFKDIYPNHDISAGKYLVTTEIDKSVEDFFENSTYVLFADIQESNIFPFWKSPNLIQEVKNSKFDLFSALVNNLDIDLVCRFLEKFDKIQVVSVCASESFFLRMKDCFKIQLKSTLSPGIWLCLNKLKKQNFLFFYSDFSYNDIEVLKILSFFYSISNFLIICPKDNESTLYSSLKICENRFPEIQSTPIIHIFYMKGAKYSKVFDSFNVSIFNGKSLIDEISFLVSTFSYERRFWQKELLVKTIKGVLISLFLDDDVSIYTRLDRTPTDVELHKLIIIKGDTQILESFQLNKNKKSERCKSVCPGCSAMCTLPEVHNLEGKPHSVRFHRKIKNKFAFSKDFDLPSTCDFYCIKEEHHHLEPCVGVCKDQEDRTDWKHSKDKKKFDLSEMKYNYDKVKCSTWWQYHNWKLDISS